MGEGEWSMVKKYILGKAQNIPIKEYTGVKKKITEK